MENKALVQFRVFCVVMTQKRNQKAFYTDISEYVLLP